MSSRLRPSTQRCRAIEGSLCSLRAFLFVLTDQRFEGVDVMLAIDPYYLNSVVFLYPTEDSAMKGEAAGGCGCLIGTPSRHAPHFYPHIVTNAHVVDHGHRFVRLNKKDGGDAVVMSTKPEDWSISTDDDLAICGTYFPPEAQAVSIFADTFLVEDCMVDGWPIYPGDEVFFYGRFIGHDGRDRNRPVMRFGNVAMLPDPRATVRVNDRDQLAFLVECRSLSGFSGSPAFVRLADSRLSAPGQNRPSKWIPRGAKFLGIDCGHFPFWSNVYAERNKSSSCSPNMFVETNSGIAVVIPSWRVMRALNQEPLVSEREAEEVRLDKEQTTAALAPDASVASISQGDPSDAAGIGPAQPSGADPAS